MTVWYVNLEDMHRLECPYGFRDKLFPPSHWLYERKGSFFDPEPSCLDEPGTRPIQACTEHAAVTHGAEGASSASKSLEQSLPKDGACACSLDKVSSQQFCCSFILPSGHTAGPSGYRYIFKWPQDLQMEQTGNSWYKLSRNEVRRDLQFLSIQKVMNNTRMI